MSCKNNSDIGKLLVILFLLLILICVLKSIGNTQVVNEKVYPVYNKKHLSVGEFLIVAGERIKAEQEYRGWKIYRIKVEIARALIGGEEIKSIWFYHD